MVQSPSWEAKWFAASQEIPRISRNLKVHYRTHKRPPPVSILGQPNPVHIPTSHLLEIHPYIIHPSTPRSSQWCPSLRFPHQDPIHPLSAPICATCPDITAHFMIRLMYYELSSVQPSIHPSTYLTTHPFFFLLMMMTVTPDCRCYKLVNMHLCFIWHWSIILCQYNLWSCLK